MIGNDLLSLACPASQPIELAPRFTQTTELLNIDPSEKPIHWQFVIGNLREP
jgi:hypothetical protein